MKSTVHYRSPKLRKTGWAIVYLFLRFQEAFLKNSTYGINEIYQITGILRFIIPVISALPLITAYIKKEFSDEKLHIPFLNIDISKDLIAPLLILLGGIVLPFLLRLLLSYLYKVLAKSLYKTKVKQSKIELYKNIPFLHHTKGIKKKPQQQPQTYARAQSSVSQAQTEQMFQQAEYYKKMYEQEKQRREQEVKIMRQKKENAHDTDFFAGCNTAEARKKRYRELLKIYHPDNQNGNSETLIKIKTAYEKIKT